MAFDQSDHTAREWELDITAFGTSNTAGQSWTLAAGGGSFTVTAAHLLQALSIRVETQQAADAASVDADEWVESNTATVKAKEE